MTPTHLESAYRMVPSRLWCVTLSGARPLVSKSSQTHSDRNTWHAQKIKTSFVAGQKEISIHISLQ